VFQCLMSEGDDLLVESLINATGSFVWDTTWCGKRECTNPVYKKSLGYHSEG
jgi:hypothetical protein